MLLSKEPKPVEGPKQCLFMQGRNPSEKTRKLLKDLYDLKKPDAAYFSRKNDFVAFEDCSLIEKLVCYIFNTYVVHILFSFFCYIINRLSLDLSLYIYYILCTTRIVALF